MIRWSNKSFVRFNAKKIVRKVSDCVDHDTTRTYRKRLAMLYLMVAAAVLMMIGMSTALDYQREQLQPSLSFRPIVDLPELTPSSFQIYVVNMPQRQERWVRTRSMLENVSLFHNVSITQSIAVVGRDLDLLEMYAASQLSAAAYRSLISTRPVTGIYLTPGGLGCFLSHFNIWKRASELNEPAIILEDDVFLNPDNQLEALLPKILQELPTDFGLFYFADFVKSSNTRGYQFSQTLDRITREQWGTYAYIVSPAMATLLVQHAYPIDKQVDSYIMAIRQQFNVPTYRSRVDLVDTEHDDGRVSDVQVRMAASEAIKPVVHVSDNIPGFGHFDRSQLVEEATTSSITVKSWDKSRLMEEEHFVENRTTLALQLSLLYDHGGLFIQSGVTIKHPISYFLQGTSGFLAYAKQQDGTVTFPVIGMHSGAAKTAALMEQLHLLSAADNNDDEFQVVKRMSSRVPKPQEILLLPLDILRATGF